MKFTKMYEVFFKDISNSINKIKTKIQHAFKMYHIEGSGLLDFRPDITRCIISNKIGDKIKFLSEVIEVKCVYIYI